MSVYPLVGIVESIVSKAVFGNADGVYHIADIILIIVCGNNDRMAVCSHSIYGVRIGVGSHGYLISPTGKVLIDGFWGTAPSAAHFSPLFFKCADNLHYALGSHFISQIQQGIVYCHDFTPGILHGGAAEPDIFPFVLIFNKTAGTKESVFFTGCRFKNFLIGSQIFLLLFSGNFNKSKKAQYFYHTAVGNMGNGTAPLGEKGINEAVNDFQDITSLSLLAVYKNIGTFIRIVEERNILIRWNLEGKAAGMF